MFDGADTRYYLESGHKVLAIEANPALCELAREKFARHLKSGQLTILNVAVGNKSGPVELAVYGCLGHSTIYPDFKRVKCGSYRVEARPLPDILKEYGSFDFIKIDIQGADRDCVLSLTKETAPQWLSFEAPEDISDLISHLSELGYTRFKVIQQANFRSLPRQYRLVDRAARRLIRTLGYDEPQCFRRNGQMFHVSSSGPPPWESDGRWESATEVLRQWNKRRMGTWYDIHACCD
jgi:FkbM family methyltransferase